MDLKHTKTLFSDFHCFQTHCKRSTGLSNRLRLQIWGWETLQERKFYKTLFSCSDPHIPLLRITQKAAMALIVFVLLWIADMAPGFLLHSRVSLACWSKRKLRGRINNWSVQLTWRVSCLSLLHSGNWKLDLETVLINAAVNSFFPDPKDSAFILHSHLWLLDHCVVSWNLSTMSLFFLKLPFTDSIEIFHGT